MKLRNSFAGPLVLLLGMCAAFGAAVYAEPENFEPGAGAIPPDGIHITDGSFVLNVGELRMNITNSGLIGSQYSGGYTYSDAPSGEWPGSSGHEYLWGAGLWIGAKLGGATGVTTGQLDRELMPTAELRDTIYEAMGGFVLRPFPADRATGMRMPAPNADDDHDGVYDEDPMNGLDDDGDGLVDEDFGQLGDQMFSCTMYDNSRLVREIYPEHMPLNVRVKQDAFTWDRGTYENAVGIDYTITNVGHKKLEEVYVGLYVDCDIQRRNSGENAPDDLAGSFSGIIRASNSYFYRVEMGYMWDGAEVDPLPGYFGALLVDHKTAFDGVTAPFYPRINAFEIFSTRASVNQEGEPLTDADRYYLMSREHKDRDRHPDEGADYKFLMSSGPFNPLAVGESLNYSMAFVAGNGMDEMLSNAVEAAMLYAGRWYDMDNNWSTGYRGRETLVCLGDYPAPPFGQDPILGHQIDLMDESCTGGVLAIGLDIVLEEIMEQNWEPGKLCLWVNMDNCTECMRGEGVECYPRMRRTRGYGTGWGGRETNYKWSRATATPPAAPRSRVMPGNSRVEVFWDDRSEYDIDPNLHIGDFESYRIWRVEEWTPPGDLDENAPPPSESWGLVEQFDIVNEIPGDHTGSGEPIALGENTGLEIAVYEPACLRDDTFAGVTEAMRTLVDTDPYYVWLTRPPVRRWDGAVTPGMEPFVKWESYPDVLDTFYAITPREEDLDAGIVGKRAIRYYHFIDGEVHNGFPYYYAVTARDHSVSWDGSRYVPVGAGIEADPANFSSRTVPRPDGQTVANRGKSGNNIYVFPNPATREALAEFWPKDPDNDDPTGVRVAFNNLPAAQNTIRIYTSSGDLLRTIYHDGHTQGGLTTWNLMTRNGQEVVSGIYLYSVHSDDDGFEPFRGKFVVIR